MVEIIENYGKYSSCLYFGNSRWTDYNIELEAKVIKGEGEFGICFRGCADTELVAVFGGFNNTKHCVFTKQPGQQFRAGARTQFLPGKTEPGRWYRVRIEARGPQFKVFLDGKKLHDFQTRGFEAGDVGLRTQGTAVRFRNIKVTHPKGQVLFEGLPRLFSLEIPKGR